MAGLKPMPRDADTYGVTSTPQPEKLSFVDQATALAWFVVKMILAAWAVLLNLIAGRFLPLPVYLVLLAAAGGLVMRRHTDNPMVRGAQRTWMATLLALVIGLGVVSTVGAAGADQPEQVPSSADQ